MSFKKFCSIHFNANEGHQGLLKSLRDWKISPQVQGNLAEVGQNHDAGKAVLNTLLVLNKSGAIFRPTSSKVSVQKVLLCPFHWRTRPSGLSLGSKGLENVPQVPGDPPEVCQNHDARKVVLVTL